MRYSTIFKNVFILTTFMVCSMTAYSQEPYAVLSDGNTVLTFYYDNNKEERNGMKLPGYIYSDWSSQSKNIKTVIFDDSFAGHTSLKSTAAWFQYCTNLTTIIGIENLKTDNVTNMSYMFSGCSSLTSLDVSNFKTENVTNMGFMFDGCSNLTSLDVSNFKTENVTDMSYMFSRCSSLTGIDVSSFKTNKVVSMKGMFFWCSGLTNLDVSNFKTDNVVSMIQMFEGCSSLTSLDLSSFKTDNVIDMNEMFYKCSSLTSLNLNGFTNDKATDMSYMFEGCSSLTSLDLSTFSTASVKDMTDMFYQCSNLTNLDLSGFNTANVTDMKGMFFECSCLRALDLSNFKTNNVMDMRSMFCGCEYLNTICVSSLWSTEKVTRSESMFTACFDIIGGQGTVYDNKYKGHTYARIDGGTALPGYFSDKMVEVTDEPYVVLSNDETVLTFFYDKSKALRRGKNIRPFTKNTSPIIWDGVNNYKIEIIVFDNSFANCTSLTNTANWFYSCHNLTTITGIENLKTDNVTDMSGMFWGCRSLTNLDLSGFNTDNVTTMANMFNYCYNLTSIDVSGFNTCNVTDMRSLFNRCYKLTSLDLSSFKTDNVTYMDKMFVDCHELTTIYVSNYWNTDKVTASGSMFLNCKKIVGGKGTTYNAKETNKTYAHIDGGTVNPGYLTDITSMDIKRITSDTSINTDSPIYNLSGQKLTTPRSGINIINGRKVLVK